MSKQWILFVSCLVPIFFIISVSSLSTTSKQNCKSLWFNRCVTSEDCCSKNCHRDSPRWEFGICKTRVNPQEKEEALVRDSTTETATITSGTESCRELWFNRCQKDEDCCSQNCERANPFWLYGVCKNKENIREEQEEPTQLKTCQPLWFNQCIENSECCSDNCHRGNANWLYGVCKEKVQKDESYSSSYLQNNVKAEKASIAKAIRDFRPKNGLNLVSFDEFNRAVTSNGFPSPRLDQYQNFIEGIANISTSGGSSKREVAMMLAQFIHESGGLQFIEETRCKGNQYNCQYDYQESNCDHPNKRYHGRGYLQLSWCSNYRAAGFDLGYGNQLVQDPDLVTRDEKLAWGVSFSYWKRIVHNFPGVKDGRFGASTNAINGQLECQTNWRNYGRFGTNNNGLSSNRFRIYTKVYRAFNLSGDPNPSGCN